MAMVNAPEFDLNNPYSLTEEFSKILPENQNRIYLIICGEINA